MAEIEKILEERGKDYGDLDEQWSLSQELKTKLSFNPGYPSNSGEALMLNLAQEAMDNIAQKQSRIVSGNPLKVDSWRDIEGYARLMANRLQRHHEENTKHD